MKIRGEEDASISISGLRSPNNDQLFSAREVSLSTAPGFAVGPEIFCSGATPATATFEATAATLSFSVCADVEWEGPVGFTFTIANPSEDMDSPPIYVETKPETRNSKNER